MENKNETRREERRRRIMERESDRMALITGRVQNLTPSSPQLYPHNNQQYHPQDCSENDHEIAKEVSEENGDCNIVSKVEPHQDDYKPKTVQPPSGSSKPHRIRRQRPRFFSSKRINSSIIGSESMRIFCALIIAFLVVLSYIDYPLFGRNIVSSESVVASRPLYILLLTDVTIVVARLCLENRRALEEEEKEEAEEEERAGTRREGARFQDDEQNWTHAVRIMERGLVVYQAFRGVFIDCSVYAVVVICGLSLVQLI